MKKQFPLILTLALLLFTSCNSQEKSYDGTFCANVEYYNPNSGTRSNYTLTVEVNNNILEKVNFPNGYLDQLDGIVVNQNGYSDFSLENGYQYKVQIIGDEKDCLDNVPMVEQCKGYTKQGNRCKHETDNTNGYCFQHQN